MRFRDFRLERYFGEWEFTARILLGSSDPETMPLRELLALADEDASRRWDRLWLGYAETQGLPALREAVAAQFTVCGPGDVLVCSAPEEAMFHIAAATLEPGDHMVGITPAFQSSYEVPRAMGADVTLVPLHAERGWALDVAEVEAAITGRTRLIYVNFPHNPTGAILPLAGLRRLIGLADSCGAYFFSDEMYRGLEFDPIDRLPAAADLYPRAISLGGLSKAYGLAGVRLGWAVCRDRDLIRRMLAAKDFTTICASSPSEILALIAVRATDRLVTRSLTHITDNLDLVDEFLGKRPELLRWVRPRAGSVGFPELLLDLPVDRFCERLVTGRGVLLIPASMFETAGNYFRIGLGRANLPQGLAELGAFVDGLDRGAG
ncbi:MAG TPA: aminotransferase class I/II-fold pyridoxal phosphate-dependent enzyme [Streptosporangiaceae bacterium]|nr:aminotransferase class I/II-fold pyridoxal phosphate-dependent enzyme [Streptosporangiaceae bacterium]